MNESNIVTKWKASTPYLQGILRIVAGGMFFMHGASKLLAWPVGMPPDMKTTASLGTQTGIGGLLELVGGLLLVLGLFTRPTAFIMAGTMAVAYFQFHQPGGFWPMVNGGELAVLYCFVWLFFSAGGAGAISIDEARKKS